MSTTKQLHHSIIEACKKNNAKAQMQLYNLYCNAMIVVANRYVKDPYLAEDIMQDAFIKCFKKIDTYKGEVSFGAWLKKIVIHQSIDTLKRKKLALTTINEEAYTQIEETENWEVDTSVLAETVVGIIQTLKEKYRIVLSLFLLEGYDHQEIAQVLGITENVSRTHLLRGKRLVKEQLKETRYAEGY